MTQKRFMIICDDNIEFIMQTQLLLPIYDNKERLSLKTCCDLLNELYEENKKLKQVNEMLQMDSVMTERNLIEENEQLKHIIKKMGELGGFNKHMIKKISGDLE